MKIGFDHVKYLEEQSKYILERVNNYDLVENLCLINMLQEFYQALMKMQK